MSDPSQDEVGARYGVPKQSGQAAVTACRVWFTDRSEGCAYAGAFGAELWDLVKGELIYAAGADAFDAAGWWWDVRDPDCSDSDAPVNILTQHYAEGEVAEIVAGEIVARRFGFYVDGEAGWEARWFGTKEEADAGAAIATDRGGDGEDKGGASLGEGFVG